MALRNANEVKTVRPYKKMNFLIHTVRMLAVARDWTYFLALRRLRNVGYRI